METIMMNNSSVENSTTTVTQNNTSGESLTPQGNQKQKTNLFELPIVRLALDTEFGVRSVSTAKSEGMTAYGEKLENLSHGNFLEVLSLGGYCPDLEAELYSDSFDEEYNPIVTLLINEGYDVKTTPVRRGKINELLTKYYQKYKKRSNKKALTAMRKDKVLKVELENYGIDLSKIDLEVCQGNGKTKVKFKYPKIDFLIIAFFGYADYFKCFGKNWYWLFKEEALLTQFRTVKIQGKARFSCTIDGVPVDINLNIFDTRYVFPPRKGSLEGQVKTFGIAEKVGNKVKISQAIKERYGDDVTEQWCKENMAYIKHNYYDIFKEYTVHDAYLTWELMRTLVQMKIDVGRELGLEGLPELRETCGKNIEDFHFGLIFKHFAQQDGINKKEDFQKLCEEIKTQYELGGSKNLSQLYGNDYGRIPTSTVGGLLYTRMATLALVAGIMLDLDLSSCYATCLTQMHVYVGEPILNTFHFDKPTLKEVIKELNDLGVSKDAWYVRVSGRFNKAWNSLVLSDLKFDKSKHILEDLERYAYDERINNEKDTINLIDAEKPPEPCESCKLLAKEINHGIITQATLTAINDLPDEWISEYYELSVDAVIYYHPDYTFDSLSKAKEAKKSLPKNPVKEEMGCGCLKITRRQVYQNNVCLKFPIATYYEKVKNIRKKLKDSKEPIQEIYKLILNSTYGILASVVMDSNNSVAANWITSCARAAAWRMTLSLNGFSPITDGSSFNWLNVPTGVTLKEILAKNPEYIIKFDEGIQNPQKLESVLSEIVDGKANTKGFNQFYKKHLKAFLGKNDWLVEMFDYELKDEKNRLAFDQYLNTGAGNYVKKGGWGETFKCRSYQAIPELVEWFKQCCDSNYQKHIIFLDREIIKLSQGSLDAIRIIQDADAVCNEGKFRLGIPEDTAEQITIEGVSHPMGFAKDKFKLMKLISPSQFIYEDITQYKAVASLCALCGSISKSLLAGNWIYELDEDYLDELKAYGNGRTLTPQIDENFSKHYHQMARQSPVGLGLELLTYGSSKFNSIQDVRVRINELLSQYKISAKGEFDLKNQLAFSQRILPRLEESKYLKHLLAATIILKTNAKIDYIQMLANSTIDPMQRVVYLGDMRQLKDEKKPHWA